MRSNERISDHSDGGACPAEHGEHAHRLTSPARRCFFDDQGGGYPADQDLEAHRNQTQESERFEARCEGACKVGDRKAGDADGDQPPAAEPVGKRRKRQCAQAAEGEDRAQVAEVRHPGMKVTGDRG